MNPEPNLLNPILKQFDIAGKVAVVTGAGGALCGTLSRALGEAGVKVAVLDLNMAKASATAEAIIKAGGVAHAYAVNVLDEEQLETCYNVVSDLWGTPDFLINGGRRQRPARHNHQRVFCAGGYRKY